MAYPWEEVAVTDPAWSKARTAIAENEDPDGYTDALFVALAFGGRAAGFADKAAAGFLLERFNTEYTAQPNSFEPHPRDPMRWKNA